jgi:hypothetical protein
MEIFINNRSTDVIHSAYKEPKTKMQGIDVINVRLPSETVKWLDKLVQKRIYKSRSEAIRHFLRNYVLGRKDA